MSLKAISPFHWRNKVYAIGDEVVCDDMVIAHRLMSEGHVEIVSALDERAAQKITPTVGEDTGAEIPASKPTVKKSALKKKTR